MYDIKTKTKQHTTTRHSPDVHEVFVSSAETDKQQIGIHDKNNAKYFSPDKLIVLNSIPFKVKSISSNANYTILNVKYLCDFGNAFCCQKYSPTILQQPSHILSK